MLRFAALPIHTAPLINALHTVLHSSLDMCADAWRVTAHACASLGSMAAAEPHQVCEVSLHALLGSFLATRAVAAWRRGDHEALMERGFEAAIYAGLAASGLL